MNLFVKTATFAALALCSFLVSAGSAESSCMVKECPAGTRAVTYATKSEPYFACPTKELADYTNTILGIVVMQSMFGVRSNISPETGEPEQAGETKALLDMMRTKAKVRTFDQAIAQCVKGKGGVSVVVENNQKDASSIWVSVQKGGSMFWLPKASLDPRK